MRAKQRKWWGGVTELEPEVVFLPVTPPPLVFIFGQLGYSGWVIRVVQEASGE